MLIELRGTEFNRRTNLFRGLGRFNRGLGLISFRTTGARSIELCKSRALSENLDFDFAIILNPQAKSDLHWIINSLAKFNGCFFGERPIDIFIECDASLAGWGASCGGQSANGQWSLWEAHDHINYLELLAAVYALQAFVPNLRDVHVRLKLDNSTAVAYINKMGGIESPSLKSLSRTL